MTFQRKTPEQYLAMCRQHIQDVITENVNSRYLSARIKAAGGFEQLILSLLEDEKYFISKVNAGNNK